METPFSYASEKGITVLIGAGASGFLGLHTLDSLLRDQNTRLSKLLRDTANMVDTRRVANALFEELIVQLKFYFTLAETLQNDALFRRERKEKEKGSNHILLRFSYAKASLVRTKGHEFFHGVV